MYGFLSLNFSKYILGKQQTTCLNCGQAIRQAQDKLLRLRFRLCQGSGEQAGQALQLRSGQAALSLVFLIGGIIIIVGTTLAFLSFSFINSGIGFQFAQRAEAIASAGAEDALLILNRNPSFASGGYSLPLGSDQATVSVSQGSPVAGQATILSRSTISGYTRKVQVVVSINSASSQNVILSWQLIQ